MREATKSCEMEVERERETGNRSVISAGAKHHLPKKALDLSESPTAIEEGET